ncbi:ABC transporter ATP-binding protein [Clostridiaceae bacterium M8S5]|nr:ABC transporter ATP-binding protein [Clostridiaceae bacterium M8S5]
MMKIKEKENISLWKILCRLIPMAFGASPVYFTASNLVSVVDGISIVVCTFMTQKFFDSAVVLVSNKSSFNNVIVAGVALGIAFILSKVINGIDNFMYFNGEKLIERHMVKILNDKAGKLDMVTFENTEYLDDIKRAKEGVRQGAALVGAFINIFTLYVPYFIFLGIYLYKIKPILAMSLVLIFIPVAVSQFIRVKVFANLADESGSIKREYEYYERCIVDREYYKETRLLGAFGYFKELYTDSLKLLNKHIWKAEKKAGLLELSMKGITLLGYMGVLYLLFRSLLNGDISVGAFGAVFASIGFMFSIMEEIICRRLGSITSSLGTVKNLIKFLDMPEREGKDVVINRIPDISLNNVTFTYPEGNIPVISNVNLKVELGETIAIVGENGAGKTTLVKLMMGLYVPTNGSVLIGGEDTSKVSPKSIYENISAVFQKFQKYKMTLSENIAISSLKNDANKSNECRREDIKEAISKANIEVSEEKFIDGYETMLSREFDGIDLSGGQWQRIAIARGLYKKHNMIILDEPTAAIDPNMETEVYNKFAEISKDKTAILVTHRLGSAKIADRIVVMDKGKIDAIGTHEQLIKKNRKYKEMYEAQSKWYVKQVEVNC